MSTDRLPLHFGPVSNGEYAPPPWTSASRAMQLRARELVDEGVRRTGVDRRRFLISSSAMAACLSSINQVSAAEKARFVLPEDAHLDEEAAGATLGGDEFIFDVQGHHVLHGGEWEQHNPGITGTIRYMRSVRGDAGADFGRHSFVKEIFLDSDTDCCVLSALPATAEGNPLPPPEAEATRAIVEKLAGTPRLWVHALVTPNIGTVEAALEGMEAVVEQHPIAAWKLYTLFGPPGSAGGYWLDDEELGIPVLEKARELGKKIVCMHKGIPLGAGSVHHTCRDVGPVAKRFPDMKFLCYHSGYSQFVPEGPYDPDAADDGVNALVKTLADNELGTGSNVYAELGSTWWMIMREPEKAAHVLGKLLKYVGEDNVLWGSDSIWYGSPQPQIEAFRSFEIGPELREKHGYPELTPELKRKILGLNAARVYGIDPEATRGEIRADEVEELKTAYLPQRSPSHRVYGPTTRREFMALLRSRDGMPA